MKLIVLNFKTKDHKAANLPKVLMHNCFFSWHELDFFANASASIPLVPAI